MKDMPEMPKMEEPPICIRVSKSQAGSVSIGDKISISVSGTVNSIESGYGDDDKYEIELKPGSVNSISTSNSADKSIKKLASK